MFTKASRYYALPDLTYRTRDGRKIVYKARRLVPRSGAGSEMTLAQSDRLDLMAHRVLGDPAHFWRLCDANEELDPFALEEATGRAIKIPTD